MNHHIYFSPHMDDAIFSCGSLINKQLRENEKVVVINIFAGIPLTKMASLAKDVKQFIFDSGFRDLISFYNFRRTEDFKALSGLGNITILNLDFLESIYRTNKKGQLLYKTFANVFSFNVDKNDIAPLYFFDILKEVVNTINPKASLYFPIPIAGHVDHMIVKDVGRLFAKTHYKTLFYEDIYTIDHSIEKYLNDCDRKLNKNVFAKVNESDVLAHVKGMKAYTSQIDRMEEYTKIKTTEMVSVINSRPTKNTFRLWNY